MKITFEFDGKMFEVGMEAYNRNQIALPDGRILNVRGWLESLPPQPMDMVFCGTKGSIKSVWGAEYVDTIPTAKEISNEINRYP